MSIKTVEENFELVRQWAHARNLIEGATPQAQFVKLVEEISEYTTGDTIGDMFEVKDGLGDSIVVLTVLAAQLGTSIEECIEATQTLVDGHYEFGGAFCHTRSVDSITRILVNSVGELATGISKKNQTKVIQGIGGAFHTIEAICSRYNLNNEEVLDAAYQVIKDRKGRMIDGAFIKEADLENYGIAS